MAKKTSEETPSKMIGKKPPAFTLPDQDGKKHKLSDYKGKHVVLYGYPKDDTPDFDFTHEDDAWSPDSIARTIMDHAACCRGYGTEDLRPT